MGPYVEEREENQKWCEDCGSLLGVTYDGGDIQPVCPNPMCPGKDTS
jgi:hypothetical protein